MVDNTKKNKLLIELLQKQLKDIDSDKKLYLHDLQRICKNIPKSIFDNDGCCLWTGYVTNLHKENKGTYINFYFKHKKVALHRLLYTNYVENINKGDYLKYTCKNKGVCCNINHLKKFEYNKEKKNKKQLENKKKQVKKNDVITIINKSSANDESKKKLLIFFK